MENLSIRVTLMRDSRKLEINISKIASYKPIALGCGSVISLIERLNGFDFVIVDESVAEIDSLIANKDIFINRNNLNTNRIINSSSAWTKS
jgi:hypothetical protein